jgi:hypothetical protein
MSVTGRVTNGVVVLPPGTVLPEGTEVQVTSLISPEEAAEFTDELLKLANQITNLPPDLAENHDHYLHGLPKK